VKDMIVPPCPHCRGVLDVYRFAIDEPVIFRCYQCMKDFDWEHIELKGDDDMIRLGDLVRDRVTGFTGTVVCKTEWLNNCIRIGVQPKMELKEGETQKLPEVHYIDEPQLEIIVPLQGAESVRPPRAATGGDRDEPRRTSVDDRR